MTGHRPPSAGPGDARAGRLTSVNVGQVRTLRTANRVITSAIWKHPVEGRLAVDGVNLGGDDQADRSVHGGPDKAIYAYATEDTAWWERQLGRRLEPGSFGENLSTAGVEVTNALIGERWAVGPTVLEVRQPRLPCFKLGLRMDDPLFPKRFARAGRPGAYLSIVQAGTIGSGDSIEVLSRPDHAVTVGLVASVYQGQRGRRDELLAAPQLPEVWRHWAEGRPGASSRAWRTGLQSFAMAGSSRA